MRLNTIYDNEGSRYKSKRLGRGIGSGKGKTCGRGYKGQKSRTGVAIKGFEGGQMPLYMRLPKRGFSNKKFAENIVIVNLKDINTHIASGRIANDAEISKDMLISNGLMKNTTAKLKLLGNGDYSYKNTFVVDFASEAAVKKVSSAGGKVQLTNQ